MHDEPRIEALRASAYRIPTEAPESDGTAAWDATTLVVAEASAAGRTGLGYTYADAGAGRLVASTLADVVCGRSAFDLPGAWMAMRRSVRNLGPVGLAAMAISAVDVALWDLKAKLLQLPLVSLLGGANDAVEVYGSGGFTSLHGEALERHCAAWIARGHRRVKIKIGREPDRDVERVALARRAIGDAELLVDANGAYDVKRALALASRFVAEASVTWLEEPVSSEHRAGLRLLRERAPAGLDIAAGEYVYSPADALLLLQGECVDVLQADATRCFGITGLLGIASLCEAFQTPLSTHCAPALHLHAAAASPALRHMEWFYDHERIEQHLFDGAPRVAEGRARPRRDQPGHGLTLRRQDAERFAVFLS
jgi:L-alanine-DL-glutamate epimerase-like enolase superfamily enzyme